MSPELLPLPFDPRRLRGLSARLIDSHHANNYSGAVKRLRALREKLAALDVATAPGFVLNGLKREELLAANSMALHELYFAGLGGDGKLPEGGLTVGMARDFCSVERWRAEFTAMGTALGGGSGWVLLSWSGREQRLLNHWAADHAHLPAGATPILALDMYEHAYQMDFGADAKSYVTAFMDNIDWNGVSERYAAAVESSCAALGVLPDKLPADAVLLDVRRRGAYEASPATIKGARWLDPEKIDDWVNTLQGKKVAVYCVYGHEVGQSTAARLRNAGVEASFIRGGIVDWKAAGRPMEAR